MEEELLNIGLSEEQIKKVIDLISQSILEKRPPISSPPPDRDLRQGKQPNPPY